MNGTMGRIRQQALYGGGLTALVAGPPPAQRVNGGAPVGGTMGVFANANGIKAGVEATGQISLTILGGLIIGFVAFNVWTRGLQA